MSKHRAQHPDGWRVLVEREVQRERERVEAERRPPSSGNRVRADKSTRRPDENTR
jgi:hypothetical protein